MKILQLTNGLNPGGVELSLLRLTDYLRARGDEVTVCALARRGLVADELAARGVRVVCPELTSPTHAVKLISVITLIRELKPDVVHAHLFAAEVVAALALPLSGVNSRLVVSKYETGYWMQWYHRLGERWLRRRADAVIADSISLQELLIRRGYDPARIRVAYPLLREEMETAPAHLDPAVFTILMAARFERVKGHRELVDAARELRAAGGEFRILFAGDGEERPAIEARVREAQLEAQCSFLGFTRGIPKLMAESSILVLPSLAETTPLVLLEAMAAGLPIVATTLPGITEIVKHGCEALLVPPGNRGALAAALRKLMDYPELRRRLAAAAGERYRRSFRAAEQLRLIAESYER